MWSLMGPPACNGEVSTKVILSWRRTYETLVLFPVSSPEYATGL